MTTVVISQPMLFPWPGLFEQRALADVYIDLDDAQFSRGSFTNRIQLKFPGERRWMTVPLEGKGSFQRIADLQAVGEDWKRSHRDMLRQSLREAPHLSTALEIFDGVYRHRTLCDLLIESVDAPAAYMGLPAVRERVRASRLGIGGTSWRRVLDLVLGVGGTRYLTGHGAAGYLDHEAFEQAGVAVEYMDYSCTPWRQSGGAFTPYVTILDLIAHHGPEAGAYLKPATRGWREFLQSRRA